MATQALAVVTSAAAGDMPAWLADTYNDSEGELELERLWLDLKTMLDGDNIPLVVFQLRNAFGGYCDNWKASQSIYNDGATRNPWMDGGCVPDAPTSVSATTSGSVKVTIS